jgi:hypothetical protein
MALCLVAAPVHAQTAPVLTMVDARPIAELTAGVSLQGPADVNQRPACEQLALPCQTERSVPDGGLAVSAAIYPNDAIGIVGEVSVYANPWSSYGTDCPPIGGLRPPTCAVRQTDHPRSALVGVKVRTGFIKDRSTRWRLFGQALGGPQWSDVRSLHRVVQLGVGADDYLQNGVALHVEYDYRFAPDERRNLSTGRYLLGIGIPLGSRH